MDNTGPLGTTNMTMKPEVKAEWLAALRSGDYQQARRYLRRIIDNNENEGYCCLGVLCDLYLKETGKGKWSEPTSFGSGFRIGTDDDVVFIPEKTDLPVAVRKWSGLIDDSTRAFLAQKNDGGWTFEQIADWIETNL